MLLFALTAPFIQAVLLMIHCLVCVCMHDTEVIFCYLTLLNYEKHNIGNLNKNHMSQVSIQVKV